MARGRLALLAALCLFISVLALHVEARKLPASNCGPLGKHHFRCVPPLDTRSVQASIPEQLSPSDIHEASNVQGDDSTLVAHPKKEATSSSSTSGAGHDGVEGITTSISKDPECGPLEKNHFRCGNSPRIHVRDINGLA